jgi:two-component system, NtrC family, sensor kinase
MPSDAEIPDDERLTDLGHLASAVGHHVINAYSAIVSNAEILRMTFQSQAPVDPAQVADQIIRSALEASQVARRLIDYTRPVTFMGDATVALDALIVGVAERAQAQAPRGVTIRAEPAAVPAIKGHEDRLSAMLGHLIANAREALPPSGGSIILRTATDARGVIAMEVQDSGSGMTPEILSRAVEPFFTTKSGRLGVGLSIANGIWRRHRGTLAIHTRAGEGTRIRLAIQPQFAERAG